MNCPRNVNLFRREQIKDKTKQCSRTFLFLKLSEENLVSENRNKRARGLNAVKAGEDSIKLEETEGMHREIESKSKFQTQKPKLFRTGLFVLLCSERGLFTL